MHRWQVKMSLSLVISLPRQHFWVLNVRVINTVNYKNTNTCLSVYQPCLIPVSCLPTQTAFWVTAHHLPGPFVSNPSELPSYTQTALWASHKCAKVDAEKCSLGRHLTRFWNTANDRVPLLGDHGHPQVKFSTRSLKKVADIYPNSLKNSTSPLGLDAC